MKTSRKDIKGFTPKNWEQRWDILEEVANIALLEKFNLGLPKEFKIERQALPRYLEAVAKQQGYRSYQELAQHLNIGNIDNAIIVLAHKVIVMDHNPGPENYNTRYLGEGKFGKVKVGIDREGNQFAIKSQRHRLDARSERELAIMRKMGMLVGTVYRSTTTDKAWIDNKPISKKELSVMKLIEGESLSEYINIRGKHYHPFKHIEREIIALGLIQAIDRLNDLGIAHRDHSLENFMFDISQLPPDLTQIDITAYLAGKDPNYDFTKLIREVDWGLAAEIPTDGSSCTLQSPVSFAYDRTAPEFYINNKSCSRASEAYTLAKLIREQLYIHNDFVNAACPPALAAAMKQYEIFVKKTLAFTTTFRALDSTEKQEHTANNELLFKQLMAETTALKEAFFAFPPSTRLSLAALADGFKAHITADAYSLKQPLSYSPTSNSPSSSNYAEYVNAYEEEVVESSPDSITSDTSHFSPPVSPHEQDSTSLSSTGSSSNETLSSSTESLDSSSDLEISQQSHTSNRNRLTAFTDNRQNDYHGDDALPPELYQHNDSVKKPQRHKP